MTEDEGKTDRAYDIARPTIPGASPLPMDTLAMAKPAAEKIMIEPMDSTRTPSQRFAVMDGKYARMLASRYELVSMQNRSCWP